MLKIEVSNNVPDSTYFRISDVNPTLEGDTLTIYSGKGTHRSWGSPQVTSTVVVELPDFVVIHVGFSHKHRGGQGWYYYLNGARVTWQQLDDTYRQIVLDNKSKAPAWAKIPGGLKSQTAKPTIKTQTAYKLVRVLDDGRMVSLFDNCTEYAIGKRLAQKATEDHGGGYFSYDNVGVIWGKWIGRELVPYKGIAWWDAINCVALLEVEISGRIVNYGIKQASTYIKPVKVLEYWQKNVVGSWENCGELKK
jgi:hypothetical protein